MSKAVIPVSGGIDSSVILAYAKTKHTQVFPITFDYNQRHSKELMFAEMQTGESFNKISLSSCVITSPSLGCKETKTFPYIGGLLSSPPHTVTDLTFGFACNINDE